MKKGNHLQKAIYLALSLAVLNPVTSFAADFTGTGLGLTAGKDNPGAVIDYDNVTITGGEKSPVSIAIGADNYPDATLGLGIGHDTTVNINGNLSITEIKNTNSAPNIGVFLSGAEPKLNINGQKTDIKVTSNDNVFSAGILSPGQINIASKETNIEVNGSSRVAEGILVMDNSSLSTNALNIKMVSNESLTEQDPDKFVRNGLATQGAGSNISVMGNLNIAMETTSQKAGGGSNALNTTSSINLNGDTNVIKVNGHEGALTRGLLAQDRDGNSGTITFKDGATTSITATSDTGGSNIMQTTGKGQINFGKNSNIILEGTSDATLYGLQGSLNVGENSTITLNAKAGAFYGFYASSASNIKLGESTILNIDATAKADKHFYGIYANGGNITLDKNSSVNIKGNKIGDETSGGMVGFTAKKNGTLSAEEGSKLTTNLTCNGSTYGLYATNSSNINLKGDFVGIINSAAEASSHVYAKDGAKVNVDGSFINSGNVKNAIKVDDADTNTADGAKVTINKDGKPSVVKLTGNLLNLGTKENSIDINFDTKDSFFTGASKIENTNLAAENNLAFSNGATWNVTGDSTVSNLVNNSLINLRHNDSKSQEKLTVNNLSGNGSFLLNTDLASTNSTKNVQGTGDKIIITTSSSGANELDIRDTSLDNNIPAEGYLLLVEDQSKGSATFTAKEISLGGIFKYTPILTSENPSDYTGYNANSKNWYLTSIEKTTDLTDNTKASLDLSSSRYGTYLATYNDGVADHLDSFHNPFSKSKHSNDLWARIKHGNLNGNSFDGHYSTFQLGFDKETGQNNYTGIAFSHTTGKYDYTVANGSSSMNTLSAYNTWSNDKGHFVDIIGRIGQMKGDYDYTSSNYSDSNDYSSMFYSLSAAYGKHNKLSSGFFYEPQVSLTLGKINGDSYVDKQGTQVKQDSMTSLISDLGIKFGKEFNAENANKNSSIYANINWLHDFKGEATTHLRDSKDSYTNTESCGGSWVNLGIGADVNLNKTTKFTASIGKNFGGKVKSNWVMQLGCNWMF